MALVPGKVLGGVNLSVKAQVQSDGSWQATVANIGAGVVSVIVGTTLGSILVASSQIALAAGGPAASLLVFVPGSVLVTDAVSLSFSSTQQGLTTFLNSQEVIDFQNYLSQQPQLQNLLSSISQAYDDVINNPDVQQFGDRLLDFLDDLNNGFGIPDYIDGLSDRIGSAVDGVRDAVGRAIDLVTPIALDLNGDGIGYTALASGNVYFDIDNDQFAERVEWLDANDGFLVRDLNGNGQIDNVGEMFGAGGGTTAYAKLATLDTNPNGRIDAADAAFSSLRIWQDANINGRVDAGELRTLTERNIASISTAHTNDTIFGGHPVAGTSTFTYVNGTTGNAADVLLQTDQVDSWYVGTDGNPEVDLDTLFLPQLRGYGVLPSLNYAMTQDPSLKTLVANFVSLNTATQMQDAYAQTESIILKWAGAAGISATSRGDHVDARHLAVLEDITDRPFSQPLPNSTQRTPNPGPNVEGILGNAYAQFANEILTRLLVQGPLSAVFENARYDYTSDKLILNDTLDAVIARATANAPTGSALNIEAYWNEIARVVTTYSGELQTTAASAQIAVNAAAGSLTSIITVFGGSASDYVGADGGGSRQWDGTRDVFWGGAGNDTLRGGHGSDVYLFGRNEGNDVIGEYLSHAFSEIPDAIVFRDGILPADVTLTKSGTWDLLISISGSSQTILVKDYYVTEYHRIEEIRFSNGVVWGASTIHGLANNALTAPIIVNGTTGNDTFTPTTAQAAIITGTGVDTLVLNASSSAFISISDFNYAQGDRINITAFNGQITKLADLNIENVLGRAQFTLPGGKLVVLSGVDARLIDTSWFISGTLLNTGATLLGTSGNDVLQTFGGNDSISGGDGNDTIDGGLGSDTMVGGLGNDTYFVNIATDVVTESANQGTDSIFSAVTYTLGLNVENLTLTGSTNINGTGNTLNNVITGNAGNNSIGGGDGNDTIDGGLGNDTLVGGLGNDTFIVNVATDVVTESASQGTDVVLSSASYTLGLNVENLTLTGSSNINGTGNTLNNIITGNGGNNTIDGGLGNDTMIGGIGNDTYVVNIATDVVTESVNQGTDIVLSAVTYTLAANVENLTLTGSSVINGTGNALNNVILGNTANNSINGGDGNDTIDGGLGNDTMLGGLGDDTFIVNIATDVVTESASQGTDSVFSAVTYTLGLNIENLTFTGTAAINGTGNTLNNILTGNAGDNTLNGGTGSDTMVGGAGNDIYVVDAIGDLVTEDASAGTDTVQSSVTYTASANIENLTLTGTAAINATGNTLNNILTGNSGANILSGGAGSDTLIGGAGADTFVISNSATAATINDFVVGTDKIDLRAFAAVTSLSNLVITQVGANTTLSNSGVTISLLGVTATALTANDFILNAAAGGVINGTAGNDSLVGTATADTINALAGNDTITGNAGDDVLNGGSGDDLIFGGDGNDVIEGGLGSDLIDGGAGIDTTSYATSTAWVNVDLSINNQWNGDAAWDNIMNVENIIGSAFNDQLIGDAGANQISGGLGVDTITGNAGDDVLNGNNGDDLIFGGDGNDVIEGGLGSDLIDGGVGNDTVSYATSTAWVNVDLGINNQWNGDAAWDNVMNVENIIGSAFNDQLIGDAGANQISGGAGNDSITGGLGSELFIYKAVSDSGIGSGNRDIITDFSRAQGDRIDLSAFTGTFGFLGTGAFTGGTTPQVRYVNDGTNTILQVNTNNDTIADFEIQVNGQVAFVSTDFVL